MARSLVSVTVDNADDIPSPCRSCAFWEGGDRLPDPSAKDDWLSAVLLDWGRCGRILYVDGVVAGFALYAPPEYVVGSPAFGAAKPSHDALLLMTARILPEYAAGGLGRVLIQSVVKDALGRRGSRRWRPTATSRARRELRPARRLPGRGRLQDGGPPSALPVAADGAAYGRALARRRRDRP